MKKTIILILSLIMVFSFAGCSLVPSVELTEDEQKVIAEYSAGLLLKYDKNYKGALETLEEDEDEGVGFVKNEEAVIPEAIEDPIESEDNPGQPEFSEELTASENQDMESVEYSDSSIAEAIGLDNFDIVYKTYEAHNIFPEEESDDLVFSMQAQNGMELLVVSFGVTNDSPDRRMCDILDKDISFRALLNGSERINANKTILLNDLGSYCDEIDGYGMTEAVLVFEVAEGTTANLSSIDLIVKKDDDYTTHRLK